jgi:exopolysaccharide biosynthesis polyprenyl glycosylphosphotransferase
MRRVLVVGAGVTGQAFIKEYKKLSPPPYYLVGLLDDDPTLQSKKVFDYSVVGDSRRLLEIVDEENITDIIVAISGKIKPRMFRMILDAQEQGVEITRFPTAFETLTGRIPVQYLEADWMIRSFVDENTPNSFYEFTKRIMDIIGGFLGSVLFVFVIVPIVSIATLIDSGWPIFFSQTRVGKGGRNYTIFKFRTMVLDAEKDGNPILAQEKDDRVTRWGRFMRKVRLDETPQFLNVLKGDMSLVGPRPERPELMEHFQKHIPFYRARVLDKPGITGWAQVNFDYAATLDEMVTKLEYDLYYIKHRSLRLDLIILLRTIGTVIGFKGR